MTGCTKVSPGCAHCYAERVDHRFDADKVGKLPWALPASRGGRGVTLHSDRLDLPLHWKKPRRIFVNSMSDLFHEDVPDEFIDKVFAVMALAPRHSFQLLTKRPERTLAYTTDLKRLVHFADGALSPKPASTPTKILWQAQGICDDGFRYASYPTGLDFTWPLPNVWLGVSVENQHWADVRLPILAQIPAAVRFVSVEPLLGTVDLTPWLRGNGNRHTDGLSEYDAPEPERVLDWVIVGGESGGPVHRLMELEWLESIAKQTQNAGVPLFVKHDSGKLPGKWGRIPSDLRIREWPDAIQGRRESPLSSKRTKAPLA